MENVIFCADRLHNSSVTLHRVVNLSVSYKGLKS